MSDIELSMRRLKRIPSDDGLVYTLETDTEQKKDNLLCNFCAWRDHHHPHKRCQKFRVLKRYQKKGVGLLVRTCNTFQPTLTFRLTKKTASGFLEDFNTFRLGATWYNRVSPGTICGLYDTAKKAMFGKAIVTATHNGDMKDMCWEHAYRNHLFIGSDQEIAAGLMEKAMKRSYGHVMNHRDNSICTVIDLHPLLDETT